MLDASSFRANRPEFGDTAVFSGAMIDRLLARAYRLLDANRWRTILDDGVEAWVAHHLVLAREAAVAVQSGDVPGMVRGMLTSESVDKVSAGYDTGSIALDDAGPYNRTAYGQEYWQLAQAVSIGGFQL